jgi:hypothetical protein
MSSLIGTKPFIRVYSDIQRIFFWWLETMFLLNSLVPCIQLCKNFVHTPSLARKWIQQKFPLISLISINAGCYFETNLPQMCTLFMFMNDNTNQCTGTKLIDISSESNPCLPLRWIFFYTLFSEPSDIQKWWFGIKLKFNFLPFFPPRPPP